jgi:GntR family transcriptional repressor for pyruvate dehydrogenase complex
MALEPITRRSLSDAVFEQLSTGIVEGRFEPGSTLPAERDLCRALGVNRGAVREALKRLAQAGLVSIRQGDGARVLDYRRTASMDLLAQLLFRPDGLLDTKVARGVMEMRAALAPDVARLCAKRRSPELVARLEARVDAMARDASDLAALQLHALELWELLVEGSDNVAYALAFNSLRATYEQIREVMVQVVAEEVSDLPNHRALVAAIARGDEAGAAKRAMALVRPGTEGVVALLELLDTERAKHGASTLDPDTSPALAAPRRTTANKPTRARPGERTRTTTTPSTKVPRR